MSEWMIENESKNVSPINTEFLDNRSDILYSSKSQLYDHKTFCDYFLSCKIEITTGTSWMKMKQNPWYVLSKSAWQM